MASRNKAILPPIPKGLNAETIRFLSAVREAVQIQTGQGRGDPLDRAITLREWVDSNGTRSLNVGNIASGGDTPLYNDPLPSAPTGVQILPTFETVLCTWDRISSDSYASTNIYRATWGEGTPRPTYVDSIQVGSVSSPFFTDFLPPGTRAVYWIRHVNRDNGIGPSHLADGTEITLFLKPSDVIREYSDAIYESDNYLWLRSSTSMMDAINRAYNLAGIDSDSPLALAFNRADSFGDLLAEQSMADALDKYSSQYEFQAQFSKNYARLSGGVFAAVDASEAYVGRINTLEANFQGVDSTITSRLDSFELALAGEAGAIATKIDTYQVEYDGNNVSLQQLASASANAAGDYVAQWGVKTDVNGLQGGVGFYNDGATTSFLVDANRFAVTNGTGTADVVPFIVEDGKVIINTAVIDTATIYTLIAANITAEKIAATLRIDTPEIHGGSITGTTLNINDKAVIDSNGVLTAIDAILSGHVDANSGTFRNVTIDGTCTVEGNLSAVNIDGDVIDRNVVIIPNPVEFRGGSTTTLVSGTVVKGVIGATSSRTLVISGLSISAYRFAIVLRLNGAEVQRVESTTFGIEYPVGPEDLLILPRNISPVFACELPATTSPYTYDLTLELLGGTDVATVYSGAIITDVFKAGSTITSVQSVFNP